MVVPIAHMKGKGVGVTSSIGNSSGHFFLVWTPIAIGVTGLFFAILAARGLWGLRRGLSRLIWKILHQGVRYDERGPAVSQRSKTAWTAKMIRELKNLGYRVEPASNPA